MTEPVIKKNEDRQIVKLEEKTMTICPECSRYYGSWAPVSVCECGSCGDPFNDGEEVVCSEGRHYTKECFERMKKDGLVEEMKQ